MVLSHPGGPSCRRTPAQLCNTVWEAQLEVGVEDPCQDGVVLYGDAIFRGASLPGVQCRGSSCGQDQPQHSSPWNVHLALLQ